MCVPGFSTFLCVSQKLRTFCYTCTQHSTLEWLSTERRCWNSFNYTYVPVRRYIIRSVWSLFAAFHLCPRVTMPFHTELLYFVIIRIPAARVYCINWVWFPVRRGPGQEVGGWGGWLTTCSRAEPVSVLAGCGYPCSERGGHVAKTSGHTLCLSLLLPLAPSLLPDHPVVFPLFHCPR